MTDQGAPSKIKNSEAFRDANTRRQQLGDAPPGSAGEKERSQLDAEMGHFSHDVEMADESKAKPKKS